MLGFFRAICDELKTRFNQKDTVPANHYDGFTSNDAVILRDRRGTRKAEIPDVSTKAETMGDDPLAFSKA